MSQPVVRNLPPIESDFHFQEWAFLARVDPDAFERRRREAIAAFLERYVSRRSVGESLQRRIDAERAAAGDAEAAFKALSGMMCQSLVVLVAALSELSGQMRDLSRGQLQVACAAEQAQPPSPHVPPTA